MRALCGCDYIRDAKWNPKERTETGWKQWAKREALRLSNRDGFVWNAVFCHIEYYGFKALRICFGSQPENIFTGE